MKVIFIRKSNLLYLLLIITALFFIIVNAIFTGEYLAQASTQYKEDIPIYSVETQNKKCAITFDCAWGASDIPNIIKSLDEYKAKATFFIVGAWAEKYPDMVKLISDKGHEVANHGYGHLHMASMPEAKISEEITRCSSVLKEITGQKIGLFRAPYGEYDSALIKSASRLGYKSIQWDCDSLDWKRDMSANAIYNRVMKNISSGSVILFHNDTLYTEDVLPDILKSLNEKGFECVTVSDLLIKDNYRIRYDGRQMPNE